MTSAGSISVAEASFVKRGISRERLWRSSKEFGSIPSERHIVAAGLVVGRRRPQTASGVTFATLEDERGVDSKLALAYHVLPWNGLLEQGIVSSK